MTDYYKQSLELLRTILLENHYDFWANWLSEDIEKWDKNRDTEHHIRAYGGMGSFNDIVFGNQDIVGLWQGAVFGQLQSLAYSLAKGEKLNAIIERIGVNSSQISGWRCQNCATARLTNLDIERFLRDNTLPQVFIKLLNDNQLADIINIESIINNSQVQQKRVALEKLITETNIEISGDTNWLWNCPKCGSSETCTFRWNLLENNTKLIEASDNLPIKS